MPWRESLVPRRMARVAVVAPSDRFPAVLAEVAAGAEVEPDVPAVGDAGGDATGDGSGDGSGGAPSAQPTVARVAAAAVTRDGVSALAGWAPADRVVAVADRLGPLGGALVELPAPPGREPPTLLAARGDSAVRPLVDSYATVPYRDVDPTWFAAAAFVVMFGMMFGDVGDGLLLLLAALWLRRSRRAGLRRVRRVWPLGVAMGVAAAGFGLLYGEFFGPTGVVPVVWLNPLDDPVRLLGAAIALGAALLAVAYALGTVNRWREGGAAVALYAAGGVAGSGLFLAAALAAGGLVWGVRPLVVAAAVLAAVSLVLVAVGLKGSAGPGAAGTVQAGVESFDVVVRLGSNVVSFARLAAFGLTHAALGLVVWEATVGAWRPGAGIVVGTLIFVVGHLAAFALEALVAGVQALRLEYYELFSRIFAGGGRAFRPWRLPPPGEGST